MQHAFKHSALAVLAGALAAAIIPAPAITPSAWAEQNLVLADGPYAGQKFSLDVTPYLREVLDFFADDVPANKAVVRKSKQTGFTTAAIIMTGYTIAVEPCDLFLIEPTDSNLVDFITEKLQRTIDKTPAMASRVLPQVSRSGRGSTTYVKRYVGGSLLTAIASSTSDLRGKTRKKVIKDEASEYPVDLDGQGSPHDMIAGSYESFLASADWKEISISTPVVKGACYINDQFEAGDQRYWHVPCPQCAEWFYFTFDRKIDAFRFDKAYPYRAHYVAPCCGRPIEHHEKVGLIQKGKWIATAPAPGKHRSYHFDALSSPFVPWDTVAQRWLEAQDHPEKLKTFDNLTLGIAHEVKGDAPLVEHLLLRREDYRDGHVPARGLLLTCGADVQHSGIWYEVVAYASNGETWSVRHGFLEGETTDHNIGAFAKLAEVYEQEFPDAFGAMRKIDALAVDAGDGGRANQVYCWTRSRPRALAVKGMAGWTYPAIGTPTPVEIKLTGKKIKNGATLWPVGTWSLKSVFYTNLGKERATADQAADPGGYCHYHMGCDERFFRQQTAESLKLTTFKGRQVRMWHENGPNHLLDCRVYAQAMAEYLGLTRMTVDQWAMLAQERGVPAVLKEPDLLSPDSVKLAAEVPVRATLLGRSIKRGRRVRSRGIA